MADTSAYYTTQLAAIDAKIDDMIANPRPNYAVGSVRYDAASLLDTLYKIREKILDRLKQIPAEGWETLQDGMNPFGQDLANFLNEDNL